MIRRGLMAALALAAATGVSATGASAQEGGPGLAITEVAEILAAEGVGAEADPGGEPVLYAEVAGAVFDLYGVACDGAPATCDEFVFTARFDAGDTLTLDAVNAFNANTVAGRAFLDGAGAAVLEHFFTASGSGAADLVAHNLAIWLDVMDAFQELAAGSTS